MSTTRKPPKALNQTAAQVSTAAAADKARKAASKAALRAQRKADAAPVPPLESTVAPRPKADPLAAVRAEAAACFDGDIAKAAESMGVDPATGLPPEEKRRYEGPMLALVAARLSYTKAANGVLCNGDPLALLCGQYTRLIVVTGLIAALALPGNPYLALNEGQQSMNLRNRTRHALKNGLLTMADVEAALARAFEVSQKAA